MKISVVILNYNVRFFLELCLQSVQASLKGISSEIIVIDNNSSDDSCNMVKSIFPEVKLIENNENIGFSKGNNLATGLAKGEYLCILNPDTVVAEDTFQKILKFSDTKTNLGIVGCRFMDGSGKFLPECKRNIPKLSSALGKLLGNGKSYYATAVDQNSIAEVAVLTGAFMLMRREFFTALNGFDEDFDCALLHLKGQPARSTRRIMKRMSEEWDLPVVVFLDGDPWSFRIFASIAYGAIKTAHISEYLATPSSTYLGITADDILAYDLPSDDLSKKDIEALNAELSDPRFADGWWQEQINMMQIAEQ